MAFLDNTGAEQLVREIKELADETYLPIIEESVDAVSADLATHPRPNLLENWYFVGGGSQQGYGYFPLNSNGQTSYSGTGSCIDCFRGDDSTKELTADGLTVTRTGTATWALVQGVSAPVVSGKTITFSALITDYTGNARLQITWFEGSTQRQVYNAITSVGVTSVTLSVPSAASNISAIIWIGAENDYVKLTAVKLEVGSTQTLAHQENGVWVLNEVPSYGEEYAETVMSRTTIPAVPVVLGGKTDSVACNANAITTYTISFGDPSPFSSAPNVIACLESYSTAVAFSNVSLAVSYVSTTGFTARIYNGDSSKREPNIRWLAIGY